MELVGDNCSPFSEWMQWLQCKPDVLDPLCFARVNWSSHWNPVFTKFGDWPLSRFPQLIKLVAPASLAQKMYGITFSIFRRPCESDFGNRFLDFAYLSIRTNLLLYSLIHGLRFSSFHEPVLDGQAGNLQRRPFIEEVMEDALVWIRLEIPAVRTRHPQLDLIRPRRHRMIVRHVQSIGAGCCAIETAVRVQRCGDGS